MVIGLSYPCQEVFLQYLDSNRRIQLSARCPSIRKLDELVPLRIETLTIRDREIILNNMSFKLNYSIFQDLKLLEITNQFTQKRSSRLFKKRLTISEILTRFIGHFFKGRKEIIVRSLKAECPLESVVPEGLKFMTPKLIVGENSIRSVGHFIHPNSLPIHHLVIDNWSSTEIDFPFDSDIVRNAKFLEIRREFELDDYQRLKSMLQFFTNEEIPLDPFVYAHFLAAPLVHSWKMQLKDVGYKCLMDFCGDNLTRLSEIIDMLLRNGGMDDNFGRERIYTDRHIFIPLTRTSNILINLLEANGRWKLEISTVRHIPELVQNLE